MKLPAYLKKHGLSQQAFADLMDCSQGLVWQWVNRRTRITAEWARKIEDKTGGEVTRHDCRPDLFDRVASAVAA